MKVIMEMIKRSSSPKMRAPMGLERAFQSPPPPKITPITVNLNEITVKILTLDQEPVTVKLDTNDTLSVVKSKIEETFRSKNLTSIPPAQQRVIFCGQILTPETLKVKEIQNIADGCSLHLVNRGPIDLQRPTVQPSRHEASTQNRFQPYAPARPTTTNPAGTGEYDTLQERAQSSLAHQRLHNCRVLQRNFNACVDAAQTNLDPSMRTRYNEPISETSEFPHVRDLGLFTRDMAYTMLTWSIQLHRLADQLIRDEALPDRNSEIYQRHRRLIQNNMDAARYY